MTVRYFVEYQMADRRERPEDPGPIRFEVGEQVHLLPNVGNYVQISGVTREHPVGDGKVRSKLFRLIAMSDDEAHCHVNIVVERDSGIDRGALIKE
jgi:hypothetical protein